MGIDYSHTGNVCDYTGFKKKKKITPLTDSYTDTKTAYRPGLRQMGARSFNFCLVLSFTFCLSCSYLRNSSSTSVLSCWFTFLAVFEAKV